MCCLLCPLHPTTRGSRCCDMGLYPLRPLDRPLWCLWKGMSLSHVLSADDQRRHLMDPSADSSVTRVQMYINEDAEGDSDVQRMKNAVWVDLASALLWFIATLAALGYWWKHRDTRSRFTGRAHV